MSPITAIQEAIERALVRSVKGQCTTHVNAQVRLQATHIGGYKPVITYTLSDWYNSDATVYTANPDGTGEIT